MNHWLKRAIYCEFEFKGRIPKCEAKIDGWISDPYLAAIEGTLTVTSRDLKFYDWCFDWRNCNTQRFTDVISFNILQRSRLLEQWSIDALVDWAYCWTDLKSKEKAAFIQFKVDPSQFNSRYVKFLWKI